MDRKRVSVDELDALLPQTQCARCGYAACRPYAEALAAGAAEINRCPPGGKPTIMELARSLGRNELPLDPTCGANWSFRIAIIDEAWCIGCTLCIQACPVDAIVGSGKFMHSVIAAQCTGCELCIAPCPTDCITMLRPAEHPQHFDLADTWGQGAAERARSHYMNRLRRLERNVRDKMATKARGALRHLERDAKRDAIADAVRRVRARRTGP